MSRKKPTTVLAHKKASVTLHRSGLTIEVTDVAAEDCGIAAKELLDVMRTLSRAYDELTPDAGSAHAGSLGEFDDDDEIEPAVADPPVMRTPKKIGF